MPRWMHSALLLVSSFAGTLCATIPLSTTAAEEQAGVRLSDLSGAFTRQAQLAAESAGVVITDATLRADAPLQDAPALTTLARQLDVLVVRDPPRNSKRAALPVKLSVMSGRVMLAAPLLDEEGETLDLVVASLPLSLDLEVQLGGLPSIFGGYVVARLGSVDMLVREAAESPWHGAGTLVVANERELRVLELRGYRLLQLAQLDLPATTSHTRSPRVLLSTINDHLFIARNADGEVVEVGFQGALEVLGRTPSLPLRASPAAAVRFEPGTNHLGTNTFTTSPRSTQPGQSPLLRALPLASGLPWAWALLDKDYQLHLRDSQWKTTGVALRGCGTAYWVGPLAGQSIIACSGTAQPFEPDRVKIWDAVTMKAVWVSPDFPEGIQAIVPAGNGRLILFTGAVDNSRSVAWLVRRGY